MDWPAITRVGHEVHQRVQQGAVVDHAWYKDGLMVDIGTEYDWKTVYKADLTFDDDLTFVSRDLQSNRGVGSARSFVYLSERWGLQYKAAQA